MVRSKLLFIFRPVFTYSFCVSKKFTLGCNLYSQPDNCLGNNRFLFNPGSVFHTLFTAGNYHPNTDMCITIQFTYVNISFHIHKYIRGILLVSGQGTKNK